MDELKPLLVQLLEKVDAIQTDVAVLKTDVAELKTDVAELKTDVAGIKSDVGGLKADVAELKIGQAHLEEDNRQIKEMIGIVRMREIGRLDGRIDQLTQVVVQGKQATG